MKAPTRREFLQMLAAAPAGLAAAPRASRPARENNMAKPNILLLMTDQHRADCLGCYDNPVIKTPNFDRIAKEGVVFERAYSSTPSCTPARAGLLTGLSPWNHGMLGYGRVAPKYDYEMPGAMKEAGYYTYAIGKLHYYPQRNYHGFDGALLDESGRVQTEGFVSDYRQWFKKQAPELNPDATGIGWNAYRAGYYALPEELHPTYWTGQMAVDYIKNYNRQEPMFLKVSFARPHSPYDAPRRFQDLYSDAEMPAPSVGKWAAKYAPRSSEGDELWHGDLGENVARRSRRGYYGSVTFIDEQVGRILGALEERGMLDNTLILFTSDHGDMLGDHHLWRKTYAYEGSARIPMILRWPKAMGLGDKRGTRLSQTVELRDVLPTLLDAAGSRASKKLDGDSMLKLVRDPSASWRPYIDMEHSRCYAEENRWSALTDGRVKYIFHAALGSEQLFDLAKDSHELNDLSAEPDYADALRLWRARMVDHLSERGEKFVRDGKLVAPRENLLYSPNFPAED